MPSSLLQLRDLGYCVLIGVFGGWLYDSYRMVFRVCNLRTRLLTAIGDTFYWAVYTAATCVFLFWQTTGEVRFYTFIGIAFGFYCYWKLLHPRFAAGERRLAPVFFHYFGYLTKTFLLPLYPFRLLLRVVYRRPSD